MSVMVLLNVPFKNAAERAIPHKTLIRVLNKTRGGLAGRAQEQQGQQPQDHTHWFHWSLCTDPYQYGPVTTATTHRTQ